MSEEKPTTAFLLSLIAGILIVFGGAMSWGFMGMMGGWYGGWRGMMGSGIAQVCAQSGYEVVVSEINDELLNKGLASIDNFLTKGIEKGKVSQQDKDSTMARIKGTTQLRTFITVTW